MSFMESVEHCNNLFLLCHLNIVRSHCRDGCLLFLAGGSLTLFTLRLDAGCRLMRRLDPLNR
jgi:hypothetical protein